MGNGCDHSLGAVKLQECSLTPLFFSDWVGSVLPTEVWTADSAAAEMFLLVFLELNGLNCLEPSLSLVTSLMVIWNNRKNIVKIPSEDRYCCLVDTEVLRLIICNFYKSQYCLLSLSIFPLARGGAFKCYSPLSPQRAIHLKLSWVLFKVIHMSYLRDGIKFYSFYIPIVVAKLGKMLGANWCRSAWCLSLVCFALWLHM